MSPSSSSRRCSQPAHATPTWHARVVTCRARHTTIRAGFTPAWSSAELALEFGPAVEDGHDLVVLVGRQREDDSVDAELAVALEALEIVAHAEGADRQAGRIAAGLLGHGAEPVEHFYAVAVEPV